MNFLYFLIENLYKIFIDMILDYNYNKKQAKLNISYINQKGGKNILEFNVNRFKTYTKSENGKYNTWDGQKCDESYTNNPSKFDIHTYLEELDKQYKDKLNCTVYPKLYCFDIETEISDEFPEPSQAKQPITVISISSSELNTIVLGTKKISDKELEYCNNSFKSYINKTEYFKELKLPLPYFKYIYFEKESDMLDFFLKNIVAKVPVLSGWNCIHFDWQYIVNRINNYYPELSINNSSIINTTKNKSFVNLSGIKYAMPMPTHTLIVDMMDVINTLDFNVLPIKESLTLNWIAEASLGIKKIEYDGTLQDLFVNDYKKYIYYNTIDSVLVQLINYRFGCLDIIYQYSLYCNEKIGDCFSKIALTEALLFKDFYNSNLKIPYEPKEVTERDQLVGAYVKIPQPGIYEFACCNDFASLYPSSIITCNLSVENMVPKPMIGPDSLGRYTPRKWTEKELDEYRKNPDYFVSVNGNVYKNEKDYSFRRIQKTLRENRNVSKYLHKEMEATIQTDIEEALKQRFTYREYSDKVIKALENIGYNVKTSDDLKSYTQEQLKTFQFELKLSIDYYTANEIAMKNLGNSIYGGSSHVSFYWYNMDLANDITGESRNLTLMMEAHLGEYWKTAWQTEPKLLELQKKYNIKLKSNAEIKNIITKSPQQSLCTLIYGDSVDKNSIIKTNIGNLTIEDLYDYLQDFHIWHNKDEKYGNNIKDGTVENHKYAELPIKRVIKHKTNKPKWKIKTKSGKEIIVTGDHSIIVIRDNKRLECKPSEILKTDKLICIDIKNLILEDIESIECIGTFQDEYVYDIEVETDDPNCHCFFANDILVHNTDSLYISYKPLLDTIEGIENLSIKEKLNILLTINLEFLDQHNCDYISDYYSKRHAKSVHKFELETIALAGAWLNVKKRYAQVLLWKDGKFYSEDSLPMKIRGLEIVQSSTPKKAREILLGMMRYILTEQDRSYFIHKINSKLMEYKKEFLEAPIEDICGNQNVHNYHKYILDDTGKWPKVALKCPANVRALAQYNCFRNTYGKGDNNEITGGKLKWYFFKLPEMKDYARIAFQAQNMPKWLLKAAPISKIKQFQELVVNPLNRILIVLGLPELKADGSIQSSLF